MNRKQKMYETYKSVNDILALFRRNMPLSVVKCCDGKYYEIVRDQQSKLGAIPIMFGFAKAVITLLMKYNKVYLDLSLTDLYLLNLDESNIRNYFPMLLELCTYGYIHLKSYSSHYIIDSEWNEFNNMNNLYTPKSP